MSVRPRATLSFPNWPGPGVTPNPAPGNLLPGYSAGDVLRQMQALAERNITPSGDFNFLPAAERIEWVTRQFANLSNFIGNESAQIRTPEAKATTKPDGRKVDKSAGSTTLTSEVRKPKGSTVSSETDESVQDRGTSGSATKSTRNALPIPRPGMDVEDREEEQENVHESETITPAQQSGGSERRVSKTSSFTKGKSEIWDAIENSDTYRAAQEYALGSSKSASTPRSVAKPPNGGIRALHKDSGGVISALGVIDSNAAQSNHPNYNRIHEAIVTIIGELSLEATNGGRSLTS